MDQVLIYALVAAFFISVCSFVGVFGFAINDNILKRVSLFFVAFSTGALLGGAFLHLLPEAVRNPEELTPYVYLLIGIVVFYVIERLLKWHHCHEDQDCGVHTFTYMSLIGDGIHNFIDGLIIVASFNVSLEVGIATTLAVAAHEIPQELGEFGVLIHGGLSKFKALLWNFFSAISAIIGVATGYFLLNNVDNVSLYLLPLAAGGFIYISMSDLIPELHKEKSLKRSIIYFLIFLFGLAFMYLTKILFE